MTKVVLLTLYLLKISLFLVVQFVCYEIRIISFVILFMLYVGSCACYWMLRIYMVAVLKYWLMKRMLGLLLGWYRRSAPFYLPHPNCLNCAHCSRNSVQRFSFLISVKVRGWAVEMQDTVILSDAIVYCKTLQTLLFFSFWVRLTSANLTVKLLNARITTVLYGFILSICVELSWICHRYLCLCT